MSDDLNDLQVIKEIEFKTALTEASLLNPFGLSDEDADILANAYVEYCRTQKWFIIAPFIEAVIFGLVAFLYVYYVTPDNRENALSIGGCMCGASVIFGMIFSLVIHQVAARKSVFQKFAKWYRKNKYRAGCALDSNKERRVAKIRKEIEEIIASSKDYKGLKHVFLLCLLSFIITSAFFVIMALLSLAGNVDYAKLRLSDAEIQESWEGFDEALSEDISEYKIQQIEKYLDEHPEIDRDKFIDEHPEIFGGEKLPDSDALE